MSSKIGYIDIRKETKMQQLQNVIETAFERRADITPANVDTVTREAITHVIDLLDTGALRVAKN